MKLKKVAKNAADEINEILGKSLNQKKMDEITGIIAAAMEQAVNKVTERSIEFCNDRLNPNTDLAHQIRQDMKAKQDTLITNLSSLR